MGAGGATRWGASAFLPWRSMSVHRVDLRLNRGRERESSGACAGSAIHADAVGALLHRVRHRGHCARRVVGWATRARTRHRQHARRPRTSDLGAQGPRRRPGRTRAPQRPRIQVTRPVAHGPRGSPKTEPRASTGAVGSSYAGATAEVLIKPPRTPDPSWRLGPWKECADPGNRDRHLGQLAPTAPSPTQPTTMTSHPRPPNTATTTTTPPLYNQPPTKPGTIQDRTAPCLHCPRFSGVPPRASMTTGMYFKTCSRSLSCSSSERSA